MTPAEVIRIFGGVADYGVLLTVVSRGAVAPAVADGSIVRLRRGIYGLSVEGARAEAAKVGGHVTHLSAALHHGWKVKQVPDRPCLTIPRNKARPDVVAELRWGTVWPVDLDGGVTKPAPTVIACARAYPYDEALCVADSALRSRDVTRDQLVSAALRSPRTGRTRALRVARNADGRADNPFESCVRAVCHDIDGLSVDLQVMIPGIGRVDLADCDLRIIIECDSFEFHSDRAALRKDMRRYTEAARRGWVVLRFSWEQVMSDQQYVRDVLDDVVRLRTTAAVRGTS
jgi:very-short-patch-repair endonuclease